MVNPSEAVPQDEERPKKSSTVKKRTKVRSTLEYRGMKTKELAGKVGGSYGHIRDVVSGRRAPSKAMRHLINVTLGDKPRSMRMWDPDTGKALELPPERDLRKEQEERIARNEARRQELAAQLDEDRERKWQEEIGPKKPVPVAPIEGLFVAQPGDDEPEWNTDVAVEDAAPESTAT